MRRAIRALLVRHRVINVIQRGHPDREQPLTGGLIRGWHIASVIVQPDDDIVYVVRYTYNTRYTKFDNLDPDASEQARRRDRTG